MNAQPLKVDGKQLLSRLLEWQVICSGSMEMCCLRPTPRLRKMETLFTLIPVIGLVSSLTILLLLMLCMVKRR